MIQPDSVIQGKWNQIEYRVERLLGEGANGKVYLVKRGKRNLALKIGFDAADTQSEVNALKVLSKSNTSFQDYLLDVDDFHHEGVDYPYYVMRYIKGQTVSDFIRQNGRDWIGLIGLNVLRKLTELHARGYVFGDIKVQNMLVFGYGDVELIDFGGVTAKGRSVKQFTEVYDRGYWGAGSRSADEAYDLFAFAVLLISSTETEQRMHGIDKLLPQNRNVDILIDLLNSNPVLGQAASVLQKALLGQYTSSKQVLAEWRRLSFHKRPPASFSGRESWLKLGFAASLLVFALALYIYWP
ncbi:serine/threonine protein kinase [Paenibacillus sp. S3N08]|uniref:non-specific serine/threonine protein kinase n=2 Tax=Paenibacillus agricola TaxID=2716264 RepID=A0ABX0JKC8_9BACL|nr:serine/threonine protein kinase [Paenibacillus agricola]